MLIQSGCLDEYLKVLKAQKWTTGVRFTWASKELQLKTRSFRISMIICAVISTLRIIHIARPSETDEDQSIAGPLAIMVVALSLLIAHFCKDMVANIETVEKLFTGMASFEERYCKNGEGLTFEETRKLKSAKRTCKIMREVGTKSTPVALALVSVTLPKVPFNLLSTPPGPWILESMEAAVVQSGAPKWIASSASNLFIFSANCWFQVLAYGTGIILTNQIIITTNILSVATSMFHRRLQLLVSGKQSENISVYHSQKAIQIYREIQLLACYFNQIHCFVIISMLAAAVVGQVISILGMMAGGAESSKGNDDNLLTTYFLQMSYFEGLILCFVCVNSIFGYCGSVYDTSESCLDKLRHQENLQRNKLLRRMVKSLPGIRVNFGRDNYIDKLTPVVYQQFTNEKIVDTLLLRGS